MHPPMSQQYHDYDVFASSHLHPHSVPHSAQPLNGYNYDPANYTQELYAQFDFSKPFNQYLLPSQQQYQNPSPSPSLNSYPPSSLGNQQMYPPENKRHRQPTSISSEDSAPTPRPTSLRVPKFERTYTDALEDELYDESSSNPSQAASQNHMSGHSTPSFNYPARMSQLANSVYADRNVSTPTISHSGQRQQQQQQPQPQQQQQSQQQTPRVNPSKPAPNMLHPSNQPTPSNNGFYRPLGNSQDAQRLSSTAATADSVRRLQVPNRTTVSPREAFLDYPDNADFRERTLFSKSASPYPQPPEAQDIPQYHESDTSPSNDDTNGHEAGPEAHIPISAASLYPVVSEHPPSVHSLSVPVSSRSSASTPHSGILSGDMSVESGASSDSEYDPSATSGRRASRSSGRSAPLAKSFACVDCGKRFDRSQPLQTHRRNSHGRVSGPPSLTSNKFSNTSHRCDWMDPMTGKLCNTVFSRPYDLIRHYETKHSVKRQEFVCPHCEDRKSFSRSDALRRHLRVKHPSSRK